MVKHGISDPICLHHVSGSCHIFFCQPYNTVSCYPCLAITTILSVQYPGGVWHCSSIPVVSAILLPTFLCGILMLSELFPQNFNLDLEVGSNTITKHPALCPDGASFGTANISIICSDVCFHSRMARGIVRSTASTVRRSVRVLGRRWP